MAALAAMSAGLAGGVALAAPQPGFIASTSTPAVGESMTFTAADACEAPVDCRWSFGDGSGGGGRSVSHAYGSPGAYTATLVADDPSDLEPPSTDSQTISVRNRPPDA